MTERRVKLKWDKDFPLPKKYQKYFDWEINLSGQAATIILIGIIILVILL